jgi:penicillin-binding protein 2
MSKPPEDRRPTMTPQLALRVAIVGSFALALFAIIFFRLWFLQVLSGDQYVKAATVNRVRNIDIAAPRGEVLDASGTPLIDSVKTLAVQISPEDLPAPVTLDHLDTLEHPPKSDAIVYNRLAHVLGLSTKRSRCQLHMAKPNVFRLSPIACAVGQQVTLQSYADVTVRSGSVVTRVMQYFLAENQRLFPGVQVQKVYVTHYPYKTLAAQVLGTVGPINAQEVKAKVYRGAAKTEWCGGRVRQLPARQGRPSAGSGQRAQPADRRSAHDRPRRRSRPQAVARRQAAEGGRAGAGAVDEPELLPRRVLRGHEPRQRHGVRDGLAAEL